MGQGRDPSHSLGDTVEAEWEAGAAQKSQAQWRPMEHGPNSPWDHRPHCYYFLIKTASFPLITKALSVYFSKIRQARPGKRKQLKMTHDPERAIVSAPVCWGVPDGMHRGPDG